MFPHVTGLCICLSCILACFSFIVNAQHDFYFLIRLSEFPQMRNLFVLRNEVKLPQCVKVIFTQSSDTFLSYSCSYNSPVQISAQGVELFRPGHKPASTFMRWPAIWDLTHIWPCYFQQLFLSPDSWGKKRSRKGAESREGRESKTDERDTLTPRVGSSVSLTLATRHLNCWACKHTNTKCEYTVMQRFLIVGLLSSYIKEPHFILLHTPHPSPNNEIT